MKNILFFHTQTLHAKSSLPLAFELIKRGGYRIHYKKNRPDFLSFGLSNIAKRPTSVDFMNLNSLRYVAGQINYSLEFDSAHPHIHTVFRPDYSKYHAVISTTKDLPMLQEISRKSGVPAFALGYQHIPVILKIGGSPAGNGEGPAGSFFFRENSFSLDHDFLEMLDQEPGLALSSFTFLDKVYEYYKDNSSREKNENVLVFHPGGYRRVLTEPGASKETSYRQQKDFLEKICLPLLKADLKPIVKTHPLAARYHTCKDLKEIASVVEQENGLEAGAINVTDDWFWTEAYSTAFSITFGSTSIYELWAAGVKNVYVANFFGTARSCRFSYFPSIYLDTYEEYISLINKERFRGNTFDPFTIEAMQAYEGLLKGDAVQKAAEFIGTELSGRNK